MNKTLTGIVAVLVIQLAACALGPFRPADTAPAPPASPALTPTPIPTVEGAPMVYGNQRFAPGQTPSGYFLRVHDQDFQVTWVSWMVAENGVIVPAIMKGYIHDDAYGWLPSLFQYWGGGKTIRSLYPPFPPETVIAGLGAVADVSLGTDRDGRLVWTRVVGDYEANAFVDLPGLFPVVLDAPCGMYFEQACRPNTCKSVCGDPTKGCACAGGGACDVMSRTWCEGRCSASPAGPSHCALSSPDTCQCTPVPVSGDRLSPGQPSSGRRADEGTKTKDK